MIDPRTLPAEYLDPRGMKAKNGFEVTVEDIANVLRLFGEDVGSDKSLNDLAEEIHRSLDEDTQSMIATTALDAGAYIEEQVAGAYTAIGEVLTDRGVISAGNNGPQA